MRPSERSKRGSGPPSPSDPFAAFCGVCGALSIDRTPALRWGASRLRDARVGEEGSLRTRQNTNRLNIRFRVRVTEEVPRLELAPSRDQALATCFPYCRVVLFCELRTEGSSPKFGFSRSNIPSEYRAILTQ